MKQVSLLLLLIASLCLAQNGNGQMRQLSFDIADQDNEVLKFSFYTSSEGYVAFKKWIGFTSDSGRTFIKKPITSTNVDYNGYQVNLTFGFGIKGVKAFNKDSILVYGDYGLVPTILLSNDQGTSFKLVFHNRYDLFSFKTGIMDMVFPGAGNIGYAVDADRILKSIDRGLTWSVIKLDPNRYFDNIQSVDNKNVVAFSTDNSTQKMLKTSDGGISWAELVLPKGYVTYAYFLSASKGWVLMKNSIQQGVMYYTSTGGASWQQQNDPSATPFNSRRFLFVNDSVGFAIASQFQTLKTSDSGKIWEPLPRDNNFSHLNYSHNDLQELNGRQLWVGGGRGFIEMSSNGGGKPLPQAFFKADTTGMWAAGLVNLRNFSKPFYQYRWFKNDTLISTNYHTSFVRNVNKSVDTISLVVSDGKSSDTLVQYIDYPALWISGFTPTSAGKNNYVTITGYNFNGALAVRFGGVSAGRFTVISNTEIQALVGNGSSGKVEVITPQGTASLSGFVFLGQPRSDLPTTVTNNILCKSGRAEITLQNTEPGVIYELMGPGLGEILGSVTGNGGMARFVTVPISQSKRCIMRAGRIGDDIYVLFSNYINIQVEHTQASFEADHVNMTIGETVSFAGLQRDSKDYYWTFNEDASVASATGSKVSGISYKSTGQKSLQLISVSSNGCRDTIQSNAVFVYSPSGSESACFLNPMDSSGTKGMAMGRVIKGKDNSIYLIGANNEATKLKSRIGVAKQFETGSRSFFAKYTSDGVLKWVDYFNSNGGSFTSAQTDSRGNIYLTGNAVSTQFLHFNNGDSLRLYVNDIDTTLFGQRTLGFIMKLDQYGKYLWHTILYDHTKLWQGYPSGAIATDIAIKDDHIVVLGTFLAKLSYVKNGIIQQLYDYPGSSYSRENHNYVVLKIKDDGSLIWNAQLRHLALNGHNMASPTIDKNGNLYLVGSYELGVDIYDAAGMNKVQFYNAVGHQRAFMVTYDAFGNIQWHNHFMSSNPVGDATLVSVVADNNGNTYLGGRMFNVGRLAALQEVHSNGTITYDSVEAFAIFKFDANGKRLWSASSRNSSGEGAGLLALNGSSLYVTGKVFGLENNPSSFVLSSTDGNNPTISVNDGESFLARYDTTGRFKQILMRGSNPLIRDFSIGSMHTDQSGHVIIGAYIDFFSGGSVDKIFGISWPKPPIQTGDGFFMKISPNFCQSGLIADAGPDRSSCAGDTVTLGAMSYGDSYSWQSNPTGFVSNLSNPVVQPQTTTSYFLQVTNQDGKIAHDTVTISVKPAPFADAGPDTTICAGQTFLIGTPAITGNSYLWRSSSNDVNDDKQAQISVGPTNNTTYYLKVSGSNGCASFDTLNIMTLQSANGGVTIETQNSTVCKGVNVKFTSQTENIDRSATFEWQVNGRSVGASTNIYSTDSLKNGDKVTLSIMYNSRCLSPATSISNAITMTVLESVDVGITISGNTTIKEKEVVSINSTIIGAGPGYQLTWQDSTSTHDWKDLPPPSIVGVYQYQPSKTGDRIRSVLITSDLCNNGQQYISNSLIFTVTVITAIEPVLGSTVGLRYYPNPAQTVLFIDSLRLQDHWQELEITSVDGRDSFVRMNITNHTRIEVPVLGLRPGLHVAILRNRKGLAAYCKFIKL